MKNIIAATVPYIAVAIGLYGAASAWLAILLYHAGMAFVLTAGGWQDSLRRAGGGWRAGAAVTAVVACASVGPVLYLLWPWLDATPAGLQARLSDFGLNRVQWIVFAVYYATLHPLLEELFWRGRGRVDAAAPVWRDIAFAGYHVLVLRFFIGPLWIAICFAVLVIASWSWRWAALRYGGLGVPLASHAAADAAVAAAVFVIAYGK